MFFLVCLVEIICEDISSWTCICTCCSRFYSISSDWSVQVICFFPGSVLVGCMFPESCTFLLGCWICRRLIVDSIILQPFCLFFYSVCWDFSSFISCFVSLGHLSFLLGQLSQKFVNFVYIFFLISILFISPMISIIYFFVLTLGFISLFLILWGGGLGCLRLFLFLKESLYHYKLPSKNCFCCNP